MVAKKNPKSAAKKSGAKPGANPWEDHLTRKAKAQNYPARSVYKLEEIQNKFKIIKKNDQVLDLGCAPGSWLLYAAKQAGDQGRVFGIDLKAVEIPLPENVIVIQDDILNLEDGAFLERIKGVDSVISDMAPATTGRKDVDALRSFELCSMALQVADDFLAPNGNFVCKIFQGNEFNDFQKAVKLKFMTCKVFKPESCRKQSKEIYIIAKGKR
ncbi:MAG: RlmE family RNA methyltransferase [Proteobacteria bacterium]|nr:RlmE family RNA methyltransferase [Pseudomonadota bacterium]MBU1386227.1 RlmE family RNA methyltransferase [Pseudomonadota bacterium]MBU1542920.1 RlmE family RNA methyltransferase [Pseudomonadota bacterium]MBU2479878.1 RlmE family RNA methyltransferase [Pseudomonadota bacterium]